MITYKTQVETLENQTKLKKAEESFLKNRGKEINNPYKTTWKKIEENQNKKWVRLMPTEPASESLTLDSNLTPGPNPTGWRGGVLGNPKVGDQKTLGTPPLPTQTLWSKGRIPRDPKLRVPKKETFSKRSRIPFSTMRSPTNFISASVAPRAMGRRIIADRLEEGSFPTETRSLEALQAFTRGNLGCDSVREV